MCAWSFSFFSPPPFLSLYNISFLDINQGFLVRCLATLDTWETLRVFLLEGCPPLPSGCIPLNPLPLEGFSCHLRCSLSRSAQLLLSSRTLEGFHLSTDSVSTRTLQRIGDGGMVMCLAHEQRDLVVRIWSCYASVGWEAFKATPSGKHFSWNHEEAHIPYRTLRKEWKSTFSFFFNVNIRQCLVLSSWLLVVWG